jgi:acyl carrier protein
MTQASVWGLARTMALEHPRLRPVIVDLDSGRSAVDVLFDEVLRPYGEDHVAFVGDVRSVPRLVRSSSGRSDIAETAMSLRPDATYVVTGGLGALGLEVADWMVRRGARHLVLAGRSTPASSALETVTRLQQTGVEVLIVQADVARRDDMARLVAAIRETMPPLRGLIHAAGVVDDGVLLQQNWDRFARVCAPKVDGAWNLHAATAGEDLDFFVVFSSAASVLGSAGQGNYAAANAWLDALVRYRRAKGLCGLSINWGPWDERGMAARLGAAHRAQLHAKGFGMIPPDQGIRILEQLLQTDASQRAVLSVDWSVVRADRGRTPTSLLSGIAPVDRGRVAADRPAEPELIRLVREAPPRRQKELLAAYVQRQGATILGLDSPDGLYPHRPLTELGLDSLMALSLRSALEAAVGRSLPATLVFEHPTLEAIAAYLATDVLLLAGSGDAAPDGSTAEMSRTDSQSSEMDDLSEEEAEALLLSELENLERLAKN